MKYLLHDVKATRAALVAIVEVKHRGYTEMIRIHVPWKYLASLDVDEHLDREHRRRGRHRYRPDAPPLPLEAWE